MADLILLLFPDDPRMMRFREFILEVDSWFDVFNSSTEDHKSKPLKAAFEGNHFSIKMVEVDLFTFSH